MDKIVPNVDKARVRNGLKTAESKLIEARNIVRKAIEDSREDSARIISKTIHNKLNVDVYREMQKIIISLGEVLDAL